MTKKQLILFSLGALITGVALEKYVSQYFLIGTLIPLAIIIILKRSWWKIIMCIIVGIMIGYIRAYFANHVTTSSTIDYYHDMSSSIAVNGTICDEPDIREKSIKVTFCSSQLIKPENRDIRGKILITLPRYPEFFYGDIIRVTGIVESPGIFDGFSYQDYLARFDIYSVMYRPHIEKLSAENTWSWFGQLLAFKKYFEETIQKLYPEPESSLLAGILIGSRKGMPEDLTEDFNRTGLSHIVAISGYNITILVAIIMVMLRRFGKRFAVIISSVGITLFTIFVGASPAVVRASIMGVIGLIALQAGRTSNIHIILLASVAIMVMWNPLILYSDVGFQLSFLSTAGLVYISPILERWCKRIPSALAIKESILMTLSAQIATTPIILMNFERLSVVAPLSNLLIAGPVIPFIMLFGFISVMVSVISVFLAKLVGLISYVLLWYVITIAHETSQMPFASIEIPGFHIALFGIYYLGLILLIRRLFRTKYVQESPKSITGYQEG